MEEFIDEALRSLNKDVVIEIFRNFTPRELVILYNTSEAFRNFIQNKHSFWKTLMLLHYPTFQPTDTPKEQYIAITNNETTIYHIKINKIQEDNTIFMPDRYAYLANSPVLDLIGPNIYEMKITGLPLKNNTSLWIAFSWNLEQDYILDDFFYIDIFQTKEDAIDALMKHNYYDIIEELNIIADNEMGEVNNDTINEIAKQLLLPVPVKYKIWYDFLMKNNIIKIPIESELGAVYNNTSICICVNEIIFKTQNY